MKINVFHEIQNKLTDEKFINKSRLLLKSFVRNSKLTFSTLVFFILQKSNKNLQSSIGEFFKTTSMYATKGAFTIARSKLCPKVFKRLNLTAIGIFYEQANYNTWLGHRALAIDGSTLKLPSHPRLGERFSKHFFGAKRQQAHWMSRISYLYDVCNKLVIDAGMESFRTSENTLCKDHLHFVKKGDVVLFDSYYASHELMAIMLSKGADFVFRMKLKGFNCVKEFAASDQKERIVNLTLPSKYHYLLKTCPWFASGMQIRLVKQKGDPDLVLATSLTDTRRYSHKALFDLYKERWPIEEAFKLVKSRLEVACFSGKTPEAVLQDFFAKSLLLTLSSILAFNVKPRIKRPGSRKKPESAPRVAIINATMCLDMTKRLLWEFYHKKRPLSILVNEFERRSEKEVEYSRAGQSFERKDKKGRVSKNNMNYKVV